MLTLSSVGKYNFLPWVKYNFQIKRSFNILKYNFYLDLSYNIYYIKS